MRSIYEDDYSTFDHDLADALMEARAERLQQARLWKHPDCRDPDHPGCESCAEHDENGDPDDESDEDDGSSD